MPELSVDDLSVRIPGGIPESDRDRAKAALEDAEAAVMEVAEECGEVGELPPSLVALALRVARREFQNPHGFASETLADYTYRQDGDGRAVGADLTGAERARIRRVMGCSEIMSVHTPHVWEESDVAAITSVRNAYSAWPEGGST